MGNIINCLNSHCPSHKNGKQHVWKHGRKYLKTERVYTQRYKCQICNKTFVASKLKPKKKQKEKYSIVKKKIQELYCNGMTIRSISIFLGINRKTVERKLELIAEEAEELYRDKYRFKYIDQYHKNKNNTQNLKTPLLIYDEMETHEHTSLKPLSIGIAFDPYNNKIIDIRVCRFPPRGRFRETLKYKPILRQKYIDGGFSFKDERKEMTNHVFLNAKEYFESSITDKRKVVSDGKTFYPILIKKHFPNSEHIVLIQKYGPTVDDTEVDEMLNENGLLKDPEDLRTKDFFVLSAKTKTYPYNALSAFAQFNKLCALLRLKLVVLHRKTFCTTKKMSKLQIGLYVFQHWYNSKVPTKEEISAKARRAKQKEDAYEEKKKKKSLNN